VNPSVQRIKSDRVDDCCLHLHGYLAERVVDSIGAVVVVTAAVTQRNCPRVPTIVQEERRRTILPAEVVVEDYSAVVVVVVVAVMAVVQDEVHPDWNCPSWTKLVMWTMMLTRRIRWNRLDWDW